MMRVELLSPSAKQELFLTDKHKYVAFGGARGGGKSWAVRFKAIVLALRYNGIKIMIVRRSYPELIANHVKPLKTDLKVGSKESVATYNESQKEMRFVNGSTILFRYCSNDKDLDRYQGTEVDILFIDEATQFTEYQFKVLSACVRGTNSFPHRIYLTCNPGGVGHQWVRRLFIDKKYQSGENPDEYAFIKSLVTDNVALMRDNPDYIKQLESLPPKLRKAWLEGNWDIFEGMVFEDLRLEPDVEKCAEHGISVEDAKVEGRWTHVIEPFNPPSGWKIFRSYDFGYGKPFSFAWWAMDYDGVLYRILEWYGCTETPNEGLKLNPHEQFKHAAEIEKNHPYLKGKKIYGVADPAIWDASRGESIAEVGEKYGIYFDPGDNARIAGLMQMHFRLQFNDEGYPMMYFFSNCKAIIRTLPLLMYDEHKVEDIDTDLEDHAYDDARYMCMSRPITPKQRTPEHILEDDPLNMIHDQEMLRKRKLKYI